MTELTMLVDYDVRPTLFAHAQLLKHPGRRRLAQIDVRKIVLAPIPRGTRIQDYLLHVPLDGRRHLDLRVLEELLLPRNRKQLPEEWTQLEGPVYFFGTVLQVAGGIAVPAAQVADPASHAWSTFCRGGADDCGGGFAAVLES